MKFFPTLAFSLSVVALPCFASEWKVDTPHSSATFAVRHMMVSTVHGSFSGLQGTIVYDPANLAASQANLTINAATVDTRDDNRDKHLKSADFLDVTKYPTITFVSKLVEPESSGKFQLVGDMTLHGVTKRVTFQVDGVAAPVKDSKGNLHSGATATTTVNRKEFGLVWNKDMDGGGVLVGDDVSITVEVELVQVRLAAPSAN